MPAHRHKPTAELRSQISFLSAAGFPLREIARTVKIDRRTIERHYRKELNFSKHEMASKVLASCYRSALRGSVRAQMFLLQQFAPSFQPPAVIEGQAQPVPVIFEFPADDWEVLDGGPSVPALEHNVVPIRDD